MLKYAKIINEETKQCEVGIGTNITFYKSIGMAEMEVEQAWNGAWYLSGYAPEKPEEEVKKEEIERLKKELSETDYKIIKCSEYSLAGVALPYDIAELHAKRQALRDRINELEG
jgi:predicted S18 family serine protease